MNELSVNAKQFAPVRMVNLTIPSQVKPTEFDGAKLDDTFASLQPDTRPADFDYGQALVSRAVSNVPTQTTTTKEKLLGAAAVALAVGAVGTVAMGTPAIFHAATSIPGSTFGLVGATICGVAGYHGLDGPSVKTCSRVVAALASAAVGATVCGAIGFGVVQAARFLF